MEWKGTADRRGPGVDPNPNLKPDPNPKPKPNPEPGLTVGVEGHFADRMGPGVDVGHGGHPLAKALEPQP